MLRKADVPRNGAESLEITCSRSPKVRNFGCTEKSQLNKRDTVRWYRRQSALCGIFRPIFLSQQTADDLFSRMCVKQDKA